MRWLYSILALLVLLLPLNAAGQEAPPLPLPRPDLPGYTTGDGVTPDRLTEEKPADGVDPTTAIFGNGAASGDGGMDLGVGAVPDEGNPSGPVVTGGPPQPITLSAKITETGPIIPTGLVWRVFETHADAKGNMALIAKSDEATAVFSLSPGQYIVHVAYGLSQLSDTLIVEPGPTAKTFVLETGALRLNAEISGHVPIPANLLSFEIFETGNDGASEGALIADNVLPGQLVHLNSGVYHVVSKFGDAGAIVKSDLKVEPGQITEATLFQHAAQVNFKLVSETGGEAIADVEWTVKNDAGEVLYTNLGAFPSTILPEGEYVILAKRGENVYNRNFSVVSGPLQEIEVLTTIY